MKTVDYDVITLSYYETWLGQSGCISNPEAIHFIYTNERNIQQQGYPSCIDLYVWLQPNKIIVSYGDKARLKIEELNKILTTKHDVLDVSKILSSLYGSDIKHNLKYLFTSANLNNKIEAKTLTATDYDDYEKFFLGCFPNNKIEWLREYFEEMIEYGYCVGVYEDNALVSCTDAPSMPYMTNKVQEIGINTLPDYRGKGYAAVSCIKAAENIIASGKVPQWSTTIGNTASQKLAERAGFIKLSDVLTVTLLN